jgi:hypothetical protein
MFLINNRITFKSLPAEIQQVNAFKTSLKGHNRQIYYIFNPVLRYSISNNFQKQK